MVLTKESDVFVGEGFIAFIISLTPSSGIRRSFAKTGLQIFGPIGAVSFVVITRIDSFDVYHEVVNLVRKGTTLVNS